MIALEVLFWLSAFLVVYTYVMYPLILSVGARIRKKDATSKQTESTFPSITVVVALYNEEASVGGKISNLCSLDYPPDKVSFLLGSDGSTDRTGEILTSAKVSNLIVRSFPRRRGKAALLNDLVPAAAGDVIVFSDANTMFAPDALRQLVRKFADESVGAVCGILTLDSDNTTTGGLGESSYWNYDNRLKLLESEIKTTVAANGSIYAIRRRLFKPLPMDKSVSDDIFIPLTVLSQGYRVVYEEQAHAFEGTPNSVESEFRRRSRIVTRNLYSVFDFVPLLSPKSGFVAFVLWSRKLLRWSVPLNLIIVFLTSSLLFQQSLFFTVCFVLQIAFYIGAAVGFFLDKAKIRAGVIGLPYYFVAMNAAILQGIIKFVIGEKKFTWEPER